MRAQRAAVPMTHILMALFMAAALANSQDYRRFESDVEPPNAKTAVVGHPLVIHRGDCFRAVSDEEITRIRCP